MIKIMITLLLAIALSPPAMAHNEDKYGGRCVSCNQYGMTYCSAPPAYEIDGYCADTEFHCTNTHQLHKNMLECKKAGSPFDDTTEEAKVLDITPEMMKGRLAKKQEISLHNDTWQLVKVNFNTDLFLQKAGVTFVQ